MSELWTIFTDGGSRGNPGPAGYAYVIKRPGQPDIEVKCYLGTATNNIAEYTGMLKALEHAKKLGAKKLLVNSDSELMVKQMNGVYRVKNEGLLPLYSKAALLRKQFEGVTFKHVYREQNTQADALCNEAMDARSPLADEIDREIADAPVVEMATTKRTLSPRQQALALLQESAAQWAKGDADNPSPDEVLTRILELMNGENAADER